MTIESAKLILAHTEEEVLEDVFENKLFEFKNFFINNLPTSKLFEAKFKKIRQLAEAYSVLGGEEAKAVSHVENVLIVSDKVYEIVIAQQAVVTETKLKVFSSRNSADLIFFATQMIENLKRFAENWYVESLIGNQDVKMSDVPDQMQLLKALKVFNEEGKSTFNEILTLPDDNLLMKESIRLSLWLKFEGNV